MADATLPESTSRGDGRAFAWLACAFVSFSTSDLIKTDRTAEIGRSGHPGGRIPAGDFRCIANGGKLMKHLITMCAVFAVVAGCRTTSQQRMESAATQVTTRPAGMRMGPPPPGYIRIRGESVPGWKPSDMVGGSVAASGALSWMPLGPRPILDEYWSGNDDASGRVVSIAPHPTDPNTVYIASASGGVWKTTSGGALWTPLTDELSNLNHGCVAIDPSNSDVVYTGTGEYTTQTSGDGLFRSEDAGVTWVRVGTSSEVGSTCSGLAIDPMNPQRIHWTGSLGYSRSVDGGTTWTRPLAGAASSLALNPADPQVLFVGRHGDGVYRSTNGGTTWTRLSNGLPSGDVNRVLVALAPSNTSTVYAVIINGAAGLRGFYRSDDGGDTWTQKTATPDFPRPQGWYDAFVGVDPTDENIVYAGGVFPTYAPAGVIKSTDGGNVWTDITFGVLGGQLHPDQHVIAFGPTGTIWVGNDGGVWKSANGGQSWINANATLTVTQNYNLALHPTDPALAMTGTQDNGTIGRTTDMDAWPQLLAGDGGFLAYDPTNPQRRYATYVRLTVYRIEGPSVSDITGPWDGADDPVAFIAPLVMDPNDSHTLLGGTNRVWRTNNAHTGADWTAISDSTVSGGGVLNAIAVAVGASNTIYVGGTTGRVYVTTNGTTWNNRTSGLPSGQVSDILIDPTDPATAYVSFHRTSGPRVLRTKNHGLTWTSLTGDLPAGVSARALAVDWRGSAPQVYIGSGAGVWGSTNDGANWTKDGLDLPNVNIGDLAIDFENSSLTAATYGRGTWRTSLIPDCNGNTIPDETDIASGTSPDCDANGVPDECDPDCNGTGQPDPCDIADGTSVDLDGDGLPDECCFASSRPVPEMVQNADGEMIAATKNRYLTLSAGDPGRLQAIRVTFVSLPPPFDTFDGQTMWVGEAQPLSTASGRAFGDPIDPGDTPFWVAPLACTPFYTEWASFNDPIHMYHQLVIPGGSYRVELIGNSCELTGTPAAYSPPLSLTAGSWGDLVGAFDPATQRWLPADSSVDVATDVVSALDAFGGLPSAPDKLIVDMEGGDNGFVDGAINITDITRILDAFGGSGYPFAPPAGAPCP